MNYKVHIHIQGTVQGVGFRPFVYRLATELGLQGWVNNDSTGVHIEAESSKELLTQFCERLKKEKPALSDFYQMEINWGEAEGIQGFEIRESESNHLASASVLPDLASCPKCIKEVFDPDNKRYLYPFTNCTDCGPRYSIIDSLPYDRQHTTMSGFEMCESCRAEYEDPSDRRFHAQPNACPDCGPQLELWSADGKVLAEKKRAVEEAVHYLRDGSIVAVKGIGGFQLLTDARNHFAVEKLRERKKRPDKPFAVMIKDLPTAFQYAEIKIPERDALLSAASPIVLLTKKKGMQIADPVAPETPLIGIMLPYSPLHHILCRQADMPLVATSGNISSEPICIDEGEALERLKGIADVFLVHNRPVLRHVDDSVVHMVYGGIQVLRRARGYAPLPIKLERCTMSALSVGGHLKNTVALLQKENAFVSQHIGDLESPEAMKAFEFEINQLQKLYPTRPGLLVTDLHPDYAATAFSTKYAEKHHLKIKKVQHHYAHIAACLAENQIESKVLGVAWDGTGLGVDNTLWGGEFMIVDRSGWERVISFRSFPLPGGEKAIQEPRRAAFGMLYEIMGEDILQQKNWLHSAGFAEGEPETLIQMIQKGVNCPRTSSVGRIFDAVASLLNLKHVTTYEGQAAVMLEHLAVDSFNLQEYPFKIKDVIDWEPIIRGVLKDQQMFMNKSDISGKFHHSLARIIMRVCRTTSLKQVAISGGCFQNRILTESVLTMLTESGYRCFWHRQIPPNDGGISLGQLYAIACESHGFLPDEY